MTMKFHRLFIFIFFALLAGSASGMSLAEYQKAVEEAHGHAYDIITEINDGGEGDTEYDDECISEMRRLLPAELEVETGFGKEKFSHSRLHELLKQYETAGDRRTRAIFAEEIEETLSAALWKLREIEKAAESERSKDEEKRKLAEILTREEYQKKAGEEESFIGRLIREFLEWIAGLLPSVGPRPSVSGSPVLALLLQVLVIGAAVAAIAYGLYRLAPVIFPQLRRRRRKDDGERVILGETIGEDVTAKDLLAEAEALAAAGDHRGAIRKGYIALLCELSDRKLIGLARHKTNRDYLRDLRREAEIHRRMQGLTGIFERAWYGSDGADGGAWAAFRNEAREAIRQT